MESVPGAVATGSQNYSLIFRTNEPGRYRSRY